jgi:hypothetical protein
MSLQASYQKVQAVYLYLLGLTVEIYLNRHCLALVNQNLLFVNHILYVAMISKHLLPFFVDNWLEILVSYC